MDCAVGTPAVVSATASGQGTDATFISSVTMNGGATRSHAEHFEQIAGPSIMNVPRTIFGYVEQPEQQTVVPAFFGSNNAYRCDFYIFKRSIN